MRQHVVRSNDERHRKQRQNPDTEPEHYRSGCVRERDRIYWRLRIVRVVTFPGTGKANQRCCQNDYGKRHLQHEDAHERSDSDGNIQTTTKRAPGNLDEGFEHDRQNGRLDADEHRLDHGNLPERCIERRQQ